MALRSQSRQLARHRSRPPRALRQQVVVATIGPSGLAVYPLQAACADTPIAMTRSPETAINPDSDALAEVARGGMANLVGAVVSTVANFGLTVVIAHQISPSAAGVFFTVTSLFLMLESLGRLGADTGLVYFVARWRALGQDERIRPGLRATFAPIVVGSGVLAVAMFVCAPQIAHLADDKAGHSVGLVRLLAVLLPLASLYDVILGATRGFGWMRPTVVVEKIARPGIQFLLVGGVLVFGWEGALGYAWALPYVGGFVVAAWMLRTAVRTRLSGDDASDWAGQLPSGMTREFWNFAVPRAASGVAQFVLQRLDIVLVAAMRGARDAAIYTAATRFLVVGQFLNQAITNPVQPHLSAALSAGHKNRARDLYRASTTWLVLASWPLFGLAAVFAPAYVGLFGHDYRSGTSVVVILALAMLVATGVGLVDTVVIMAGKASWSLQMVLLSLVVNVGLDVALIPHFGLIGAAVGWVGSILAGNLLPLYIAWRRLDMHPFGRSTFVAYALCAICFLGLPVAGGVFDGGRLAGSVVGVGLGVIVYCWGLWKYHGLFDLSGVLRRRAHRVPS